MLYVQYIQKKCKTSEDCRARLWIFIEQLSDAVVLVICLGRPFW